MLFSPMIKNSKGPGFGDFEVRKLFKKSVFITSFDPSLFSNGVSV